MTRPSFKWPDETSMALRTRLRFVQRALASVGARSVLDIGCGTGEFLTSYMAELFPEASITGVDSDSASIDYGRERFSHLENLAFFTKISKGASFDAIVASEVIEHVENPYEFMIFLRSMLRDGGVLVLTMPNGYGCSEIMSALEALCNMAGIIPVMKKIKHAILPNSRPADGGADTLADSPHVNFFTLRKLRKIFYHCGFVEEELQGRMLLHNFICSKVLDTSEPIAKVNAYLGIKLHPNLVSDWMFVLTKDSRDTVHTDLVFERNGYERVKGFLSRHR